MRVPHRDLKISRKPLCDYGSLEGMIRGIREHRPLDLNAEHWRRFHPSGMFEQWHQEAHHCLMEGLHYAPGSLDIQPETLGREERPEFMLECVAFNTTPWIRVKGSHLGILQYIETGDPRWFRYFDAACTHNRDVDIIHFCPEHPEWVGACHSYGEDHTTCGPMGNI